MDVQNRDKVVVLEDKADIAPTEDGKLLVVQHGQLFSLDLNAAGGGTSRPPIMFSRLDLPLPEVPTMATNSPCTMERVTLSSAFVMFGSLP